MTDRQWGAVLWAAMTAPWALRLSRYGWAAVLAGTALSALSCLGLSALRGRCGGFPKITSPCHPEERSDEGSPRKKIPLFIYGIGLALLGGVAAARSRLAFPETRACLWAGLGVLALALWTARKGPRALGRVGILLFGALGILFGVVTLAGLPRMEPAWLKPELHPEDLLPALSLGLYPAAALLLPGPRKTGWLLALPLPGTVLALLTAGILSPALAREPESLLTVAKSLTVLGVVQRFEAMICAALLTGCYAFSALMLTAAAGALDGPPTKQSVGAGALDSSHIKSMFLCVVAALGFLLGTLSSGEIILTWGGLFCGGMTLLLLPLGAGKSGEKKFQKNEKKS